jgi:hypothetical protein
LCADGSGNHHDGLFGRCTPPGPASLRLAPPLGLPWHQRTPSTSLLRWQFAPPRALGITRFFAARASSPASGWVRDFSRSQTPCTFRLRRPPDPQCPLASPVARTADDELPPSPSGPTAPPKSHRTAAVRARTAPPACPLRLTRLTTRNAFDWLDPDLSAGSGCSFTQLALGLRATGTPFHDPQLPARHGHGSPHLAIPRRTGNAE